MPQKPLILTGLLLLGGCAMSHRTMHLGCGQNRRRVRRVAMMAECLADRSMALWRMDEKCGLMICLKKHCKIKTGKDYTMDKFKSRLWAVSAVGLCMTAGGCSQWMHALVQKDSQTVAAITQAGAPGGRMAKNPAVVILRPAIQAAAQAAGPMGGEALGIVAAIASLIAGATTTVAARKSQQLSQHRQAISELARAMAPGTILHPATQRVVTAATS